MKHTKVREVRTKRQVIALMAAALAVPILGVGVTSAPADAAACSAKKYFRVSGPASHADGYRYRCGGTTHADGYVYDDKCDSRSGMARVQFLNGDTAIGSEEAQAGGGCGSYSSFSMTGGGDGGIRVCVWARSRASETSKDCAWY